jgi:hypothetical protein
MDTWRKPVNSRPDATTLADLQGRFAAALRASGDQDSGDNGRFACVVVGDGLDPEARVQVYRNNVRAMFEGALARTYPVLRRRVGDGYFSGLASAYRKAHPSRSGDLHWVGRSFPAWLGTHLAGTEYAWLADLARLEWACEEVLVTGEATPLEPAALTQVEPDDLGDARLVMQPGVRMVESGYPVWSVWRENQPDAPGAPVDFSIGPQWVVVACVDGGLVLHSVPQDHFRFVASLAAGATLALAVDESGISIEQLPALLGWLFNERLVVGVAGPAKPPERVTP